MPRVNVGRTVNAEQALAQRIAHERTRRGWSLDGLAVRMRDAGCPIATSAIYKIESGDPPRRITVDELVALAKVFEYDDLSDLLRPIADDIYARVDQAWVQIGTSVEALIDAISETLELAATDPPVHRRVMELWFDGAPSLPSSEPLAQIVGEDGSIIADDVPRLRSALSELLMASIELAGTVAENNVGFDRG